MINSTELQERKAQRKRQEDSARSASEARKQKRQEELRQLHVLAAQVAELMGGAVRPAAPGKAWMLIDVGQTHKLSFYREGEQIDIRGDRDGIHYALSVSRRLAPEKIAQAIGRKSTP